MTQAEQFFSMLYAGQTGVLELRTFGPEKSNTSPEAEAQRKAANHARDFVPVVDGQLDYARVNAYLAACEQSRLGAFFGVALRSNASLKSKKGDAAHCQTLTAFFVDADFKHLGEEETQRRIAAFPLAPSMVVRSGGGFHPYWILSVPIQLQQSGGMATAKSYLKRLAHSVAGIVDESVSEPVRVLRIPGSSNFKSVYPAPVPVVLLS
jgi:putative DNA primase/helicase